jgi:hypothetical protein
VTNANYARGAVPDLRARNELADLGFMVWKAWASKGPFDVYASRSDLLVLVQVKRTKTRIVSTAAVETAFKADLDGTEKKIGLRNIPVPAAAQKILALWSDRCCKDLAGWRWYRVCADGRLKQIDHWYEGDPLTKTNPCQISSSGDERYRNLADAITGGARP